MGNNKLIGQIPNEISLIYPLLSLRLAGNPLTGSLPQNGFTNLQKLDISTTWMTGSLPYFDGRTLPMLDVSDTYISGQIPPQLLYSTSAKQASLCPFINSKVTLPLNTLPPSTCPSSIMNFNGANQRPITIPGMGNDRGTPQANPTSVGLLIGVVAAAALILVLLGACLVRLKKRQRRNLAQHISPPTLMKPGSRPFSTSTFDTLDSSLYGDDDEEVPLQRSSIQNPAPTDLHQHQTNPANGPIQHSIPTSSKDQVQVDITAQDEERHITIATPIDESDFENQVQVDITAQDKERHITFATPIDESDFENQVQVDITAQDKERRIVFDTPVDDPDFENQVHADSEAQDDPPIAIAPDSNAATSKNHVSKLVHPNPIAAVAERSSVRWSLAESV